MFENIMNFFKKFKKSEKEESKSTAKERLHLVLAQDRANISADFLEMMKQEIIEVIKKYIDIDEKAIDVRLTNKEGEDGTVGAPALYANIPIITIKNEARKLEGTLSKEENTQNEAEQEEEAKEIDNNEENNNDIENQEIVKNNVEDDVEIIEDNTISEKNDNKQEKPENNNLNEVDNEKKNS